ncbi:MAG: hypothetical protein N2738_00065 [Thermodesulfovibrionales bacterium]|nr:hypothetical protein [Thermodesulfovibrionales bacterium]
MEIKSEGVKAIITVLVNVSQFMSSLGTLLESGEFHNLDTQTQSEIISNIKSISSFLNETSISLTNLVNEHEGIEDANK